MPVLLRFCQPPGKGARERHLSGGWWPGVRVGECPVWPGPDRLNVRRGAAGDASPWKPDNVRIVCTVVVDEDAELTSRDEVGVRRW